MNAAFADPLLLLGAVAGVAGLLTVTVWTGVRGARRAHFASLAVVVPAFGFTLFVAESVGRAYRFAERAFAVHMVFAWLATGLLLAALGSGFVRLARPTQRRLHRWCVGAFLAALLLAVGTGLWMMSTGERRTPADASPPVAALAAPGGR